MINDWHLIIETRKYSIIDSVTRINFVFDTDPPQKNNSKPQLKWYLFELGLHEGQNPPMLKVYNIY